MDCVADTAVVGAISNPQITTPLPPPLYPERTPPVLVSIKSTKEKLWDHSSGRAISNPHITTPPLYDKPPVPLINQHQITTSQIKYPSNPWQ